MTATIPQSDTTKSHPPSWAVELSSRDYHFASGSGQVMSSGMLREFRRCPAHYHALVSGKIKRNDSPAFRLGRAAHKLILEGEQAFRASFAVGGPVNDKTGRSFGAGSRAYEEWLDENGLDRASVLTPEECETVFRLRDSALAHPEIASLLSEGWPERTVRASVAGVECQTRLDWLRPDSVVVDLKTVDDIAWFESDARRFGYLHQFAFYQEVVKAAGSGGMEMLAAVIEKRPPFRAGVWKFSGEALAPYVLQNAGALQHYVQCRKENKWPTGYETTRAFPVASVPAVWLN